MESLELGGTFTDFRFEQMILHFELSLPGFDLPGQQCVNPNENTDDRSRDNNFEPCGLIEMRQQRELDAGAIHVPNAVAVARLHAGAGFAGLEICVECRAPVAGIDPGSVKAVQEVFELNTLRRDEACGSIINFQLTRAWLEF